MFQKPQDGQAALFRRHPARRRRLLHLPRGLHRAGPRRAAGEPGLAHPCRPPAGRSSMPVTFAHAAQPRQRPPTPRTRRCCGASSRRYAPGATPQTPAASSTGWSATRCATIDGLRASRRRRFRAPDDGGARGAGGAANALAALPADADGEAIQDAALDVARAIPRYRLPSRRAPTAAPASREPGSR